MRQFHLFVFALFFCCICFFTSSGQHWMKTNPVHSNTLNTQSSLAVDQDGTNYIAYVEDFNGGDSGLLHVKKYDGVNWVDYGNTNIYSKGIVQHSLVVSNGVAYVIFSDLTAGGKASMAVSDNKGNWSIVGQRGISDLNSGNWFLTMDPVTSALYFQYETSDTANPVVIKQFLSNNWTTLPRPVFTHTVEIAYSTGFTAYNGVIYIAYRFHWPGDNHLPIGDFICIDKYSGGSWSNFTSDIGETQDNFDPNLSVDYHSEFQRLMISYRGQNRNGAVIFEASFYFLSGLFDDFNVPQGSVYGIQPFIVSPTHIYPYIAVTDATAGSSAVVHDFGNRSFLGFPYFSPASDIEGSTASATKVMVATESSRGLEVYYLPFNQAHALSVTSTTANGEYGIGSEIDLQVHTDQNVNVIGTPLLKLKTGNQVDGFATYASGSGSNTLTFKYIVRSQDYSNPLDYTDSTSLIPNGGAILNTVDNEGIDLTLPAPGSAGSLSSTSHISIDGIHPIINSVTLPASGWYKAGKVLQFTLNYSDTVVVTSGVPTLGLTIGSGRAAANYVSGSGSNALVFSYTVKNGDNGSFGLDTALTLNGATIMDSVNNTALNTIPVTDAHQIIASTKNPVFIVSSSAPTPLYAGNSYTVTFSSNDDPATGLTAAGILATNATISNFTNVSYGVYSATFTPTTGGLVTIGVKAGSAFDIAGNPNDASAIYSAQALNIGAFKSISPNPAHNSLNVNFTGAGDGLVCKVVLTNVMTGQVLFNRTGTIYGNTVGFDISSVPSGSYICTVTWPYDSSNSVSVHLNITAH